MTFRPFARTTKANSELKLLLEFATTTHFTEIKAIPRSVVVPQGT